MKTNPKIKQATGSRRSPAPCSPSSILEKAKRAKYQREWSARHPGYEKEKSAKRRLRNPEKANEKSRLSHKKAAKINGVWNTTKRSRISEKSATMRFQRWGPVEDEILMSGKYSEPELVEKLGRTIRAIQRRKWRIRQNEILQENSELS